MLRISSTARREPIVRAAVSVAPRASALRGALATRPTIVLSLLLALLLSGCSDEKAPKKRTRPGGGQPVGAQQAPAAPADGLATEYHDAARTQKKSEGEWRGGKQEGAWTFWHPNGKVSARGAFRGGQMDGPWVEFHEDGQKKSERTFVD